MVYIAKQKGVEEKCEGLDGIASEYDRVKTS